ncbi:hypothetical protein CHH55_23375 [Niallia circulans]|nr:hypothetical protein CHH55_23375 [Niallia circulans]
MVSNGGGGVGLAVSVLLVVMLADYVTGLLCAFVNKELNSAKGTRGFKKVDCPYFKWSFISY